MVTHSTDNCSCLEAECIVFATEGSLFTHDSPSTAEFGIMKTPEGLLHDYVAGVHGKPRLDLDRLMPGNRTSRESFTRGNHSGLRAPGRGSKAWSCGFQNSKRIPRGPRLESLPCLFGSTQATRRRKYRLFWLPSTFSLTPPTGSTKPRRLISPVMATSLLMRCPVRSETRATKQRDARRWGHPLG